MEGMEASNVTPDTAVDTSADQGQESESEVAGSDAGTDARGGKSGKAPTKTEQAKIKQQIRELGDADMDALVSIKVNGQTKKVPLREAIKVSQLEQASHQKMQEASRIQRQFHDFAKQAKDNPDLFFEQFGLDPDAYSEARLAKKLEQMSLSPEQKKAKEMEAELTRYREAEKKHKEREESAKKSAEETRVAQSLDREITDAFKDSGLPRNPFYVQLMAAQMLGAQSRGEELSAKEAALKVKERFTTDVNSILKGMDATAILTFLGDDVRKVIREAELKRVTDKAPAGLNSTLNKPGQTPSTPRVNKPSKALTEREWREWLKGR